MAVVMNLGLLKKDDVAPKAAPRREPEPKREEPEKIEPVEEKVQEPEEMGGFTLGREDDETYLENEHKLKGANADILSMPVHVSIEMPGKREEKPLAEEQPVEKVKQIRAFCVGGNETYYRNVLESLNASTKDIKFIKYMPSGDVLTLAAIESLNPDIVLVYWKTPTVDVQKFWDLICNDAADDGVAWRDKFANRRLVVIIPNDISCEIKARELGLFFVVRETNPQRHEVSVDALIDQIRTAYSDIEQTEPTPESAPESADPEAEPVREIMKEEPEKEYAPEPEEPPVQEDATRRVEIPSRVAAPPPVAEQPAKEAPVQEEQTPMRRKIKEIEKDQEQPSSIVGVYSVTGGAGTTMCATNLAALLAKYGNNEVEEKRCKVLLVEYNLSCQCADVFFNFKGGDKKNLCMLAKSVSDFVDEKGVVNISTEEMKPHVKKMVFEEERTGLDILLGITNPLEFDYIRDGFTRCLFATLREMYDYVIVDLSSDMAKAPVLDAFYALDQIYYVMPMDVSSIRNTQLVIPILKDLFRFTPERITVLLNKVNEEMKEFDIDQVYDNLSQLECAPKGTLPYVEDVTSSLNRGVPISIENPNHPISQALFSIAVGLNPKIDVSAMGEEEEAPKKKGLFASLFGGRKKKARGEKDKKGKDRSAKKERRAPKEEDTDEAPEQGEAEEKPKKKGFFASLFGGGGKKKRRRKGKDEPEEERTKRRKPEPRDEEPEEPEPEAPMEDDSEQEKPKEKKGFFAKLAGLFGGKGKKKVKIKKKGKKFGGLLDKGSGDDGEEEAPPQRSRLVSRRRKPMPRG